MSCEVKCINEKVKQSSEKVTVPITPIVLSYFAENEKVSRNDITNVVYNVSSQLHDTNVRIDAIFRGNFKVNLEIQSETVDAELSYWLSNKFITILENDLNNELLFEINKDKKKIFDNYKFEKLSQNLVEVDWKLESDKDDFLTALQKVINKRFNACQI